MQPCTLFTKTPHSQAEVELTEDVLQATANDRSWHNVMLWQAAPHPTGPTVRAGPPPAS